MSFKFCKLNVKMHCGLLGPCERCFSCHLSSGRGSYHDYLHSMVGLFVLFVYLLHVLSALRSDEQHSKEWILKLCEKNFMFRQGNDNLGDNYIIGVINHRLLCMVLTYIGLQLLFYFIFLFQFFFSTFIF